jgi:hypothetical protein
MNITASCWDHHQNGDYGDLGAEKRKMNDQDLHEGSNCSAHTLENPRYGIYGEFTWAFVQLMVGMVRCLMHT